MSVLISLTLCRLILLSDLNSVSVFLEILPVIRTIWSYIGYSRDGNAGPSDRSVYGVGLRPLAYSDHGFESQIATHQITRCNTPIHNILSTAPQLSISQKSLGTLPEDGNVMPKHVADTIHD
jgi:hypothetical protein